MDFEILSEIEQVETIASGSGVRDRGRLYRFYGKGHWRKRKGFATVRLADDSVLFAEVHWYEAHGVGKREFKLKLPIPE